MKSIKLLIQVLAIVAISLIACNKQLLYPVPESLLTTANAFTAAKDINLAVLGVYNRLQSRVPHDFEVMEIPSDNIWAAYFATAPGMDEIGNLSVSVENPRLNTFWKDCYNGIFRANSVLANVDVPTDYTGNQKNQYAGEAQFLRAMFYFDLVRIFGGVPAITTVVSEEESRQIARASEQDIYNLIVKDLQEAIGKLPAPTATERGRASKAAAVALLAKVNVYLKNWPEAQKYLDQLFADFNYSLVPKFADLFKVVTENNSEVIFTIPFVPGTNGQSLTYDLAPLGGIYDTIINGNRVARPTWNLRKAFDPADSRFAVTIKEEWLPYAYRPGQPSIWYPYVNEWTDPIKATTSSGLDIPLLRLADMILLHAEVLYNLGQVQAAVSEINKVRSRAFGNASRNYQVSDVPNADAFLDKLLLERRLVLAIENNRWFDLVRTGRFTAVLQNIESEYNNASGGGAVIHAVKALPHMKYFPIPYEQIQLAANGVMVQNPGY